MLSRLVGAMLVLGLSSATASAATVSTANQICVATANPCNITQAYDVVPGSTLDFGTRAVRITSNGSLDFGLGPSQLVCGDLYVGSPGSTTRITVKNSGVGGQVKLRARRGCSGNAALSCLSNADCPGAGTCSLGTGNVLIEGRIRGEGSPGATVTIVAANNLEMAAVVNVENGGATPATASGGALDLRAETGSVVLTSTSGLNLGGGASAQGGTLEVEAGNDVTVAGDVDAKGGDDGGGTIEIKAGDDVTVSADLRARCDLGEGIGGAIAIHADGDVTIAGTSSLNRAIVDADGHSSNGEYGSGGSIEIGARGVLTVGAHALLSANGVDAGSEAGVIDLGACTLRVLDQAEILAEGHDGGRVELEGEGAIEVQAAASISAVGDGGGSGGGISLVTASLGVCSNDPGVHCTVDSQCTVGCNQYECEVNPDTHDTFDQFDPLPTIVESPTTAPCG
jgi:hypothetical protein